MLLMGKLIAEEVSTVMFGRTYAFLKSEEGMTVFEKNIYFLGNQMRLKAARREIILSKRNYFRC